MNHNYIRKQEILTCQTIKNMINYNKQIKKQSTFMKKYQTEKIVKGGSY